MGNNFIKPKIYSEALNIAASLYKEFDFIRVELYLLDDKVYFDELTNDPI